MITATELDVLGCLGVEPRLLDAEVPWVYNTATYSTESDSLGVEFEVAPAYHSVRLHVRLGDRLFYSFRASQVTDVRVSDGGATDTFEIVISERETLRVQIRPSFEIHHGVTSLF